MNPSELLMDILTNADVDSMQKVVVIWRRESGAIGYSVDGSQDSADTMGMLRFTSLSVENDLKKSWEEG